MYPCTTWREWCSHLNWLCHGQTDFLFLHQGLSRSEHVFDIGLLLSPFGKLWALTHMWVWNCVHQAGLVLIQIIRFNCLVHQIDSSWCRFRFWIPIWFRSYQYSDFDLLFLFGLPDLDFDQGCFKQKCIQSICFRQTSMKPIGVRHDCRHKIGFM